jgi:hypothetical protein
MKVKNIAANQTEITLDNCRVLVSYETPVACTINGKVLRTETKWGRTTTRHINAWTTPIAKMCGVEVEERPQEFFDELLTARQIIAGINPAV